ncbi:hypothetical protein QE332_gp142 [Pseudomonas phage vB_PaeM_LCK69]|uniref:Uncharacterized protein n=1 Tax=Pseudomonas phage vB_PaeM_LCK69 TaxID=2488595 RepID=A0A3G8F5F3_9CAUD|nr:hypothetical protein QE332_gp142 [Pseudomonas phage vB_PaeM_LCK69]AZF89753.1 hypothetical protein [Pseudomonas phage vB_PaeM_LCK69]
MREEFENCFPIPGGVEWRNTDYFPVRTDNVHVYVALIEAAHRYSLMWQAWKASREALRVDLPRVIFDEDLQAYRDECVEALQQAGIEVK